MIIARRKKDTGDVIRIFFDFSKVLDPAETLTNMTTPVVLVDTPGFIDNVPIVIPEDVTPLTVLTSAILSGNLQTIMLLGGGTPSLTYRVSTLITGASGREWNSEAHVVINDTSVAIANTSTITDTIQVDAAAAINSATQLEQILAQFRAGQLSFSELLPTTPQAPGSGLMWNNGGVLCVS